MDEVLAITNMSRAAIDFTYAGRQYTLSGEAYLRGYGSPDFVAYLGSISKAGHPKRPVKMNLADMENIKAGLIAAMHKRAMTIDFEP